MIIRWLAVSFFPDLADIAFCSTCGRSHLFSLFALHSRCFSILVIYVHFVIIFEYRDYIFTYVYTRKLGALTAYWVLRLIRFVGS